MQNCSEKVVRKNSLHYYWIEKLLLLLC